MKRLSVLLFAAVMLAMLPSLGIAKKSGHHEYKAAISGRTEVPKIKTEATGMVTFEPAMDGKELKYKLTVKDIENVTAAHVHLGKMGKSGPPVAGLFSGPEKTGKFSGTLAEGTITEKDLVGPLSGKTIKDLIKDIRRGELYVNVHTEKYPDGEIRGQLK